MTLRCEREQVALDLAEEGFDHGRFLHWPTVEFDVLLDPIIASGNRGFV